MKKGFTLIELLVVVLIIGILAAVAYPNYQKAVMKARIARVLPQLKAIQEAEERYYMANGKYTTNKEELDIDWEDAGIEKNSSFVIDAYSVIYWGAGPQILRCLAHPPSGSHCTKTPGKFQCNGYGSSLNAEVCKSLGKPIYSWVSHFTYW